MSQEFLDALDLFGAAWATALLLLVLLPLLGIVLLLRQQVFLGAAIANAAGGGYAVAIALGVGAAGEHGHGVVLLACGWLAAVATAVLVLRSLSRHGTEMEARAAVLFLLGGAGAMVLLAGAPLGMHDVQRMFLSSLLGADVHDVVAAAALVALSLVGGVAVSRRVALWATDPSTAAALGMRVLGWDLAVGCWLGTGLSFAIHVAGLPFAFGGAVLPVLVARELCRSLRAVVVAAPVIGLAVGIVGLGVAHAADRPPGQCVVVVAALMALVVRSTALLRRPSWRRAG